MSSTSSDVTDNPEKHLRVLIVEDSSDDALLMEREVRRAGYSIGSARVCDADAMRRALETAEWDAVLCDYNLPGFGALQALKLMREKGYDLPFIVVSGVIDEDTAVAAMRAGAHDYVLKGNLARLVPAIEREVLDAKHRRARRAAEDALRESEQRFRTMAENVPQMIWVADEHGNFSYLSPKWLEYTGTTEAENVNGGWAKVVHPEDNARTVELWHTAVQSRATYQAECRVRRHDGEYRWHLARAVPMCDANTKKDLWFGTTTDIHDQKLAQEALIRSEKLASVGRMAASIAHEINNPLETITNVLYLIGLDSGLSAESRSNFALAEEELERVSHLTKQTLAFYRDNGRRGRINIADIVDKVVALYKSRARARAVELESQIRHPAVMWGSGGEVTQVLSNLVSNAIDAVPQGGRVVVRTSPNRATCGACAFRLTVADSGIGIEPQALQRIFEPFFTTRKDLGNGLGLWITHELVAKNQGKIKVRSRKGRGTVVSIVLPCDSRATEVAKKPVALAGHTLYAPRVGRG